MSKPKKEWYARWWVWVLDILILVGIGNSIHNFISNLGVKEIPNVMGLNYEDATTVLKSKGFRVTAIETDAESILSNSAWNRSVKTGEVFQINDETSPSFYDNETKDKKVTVYYAQDDYTYVKPEPTKDPEPLDVPDVDDNESDASIPDVNEPDSSFISTPEPTNGVTPEFKETMDSYEAFFDEYIAFMKKFDESDNALELLTDFSNYMDKYSDVMEKLDAIDESQLSTADSAYYAEVSARISQKLLAASY